VDAEPDLTRIAATVGDARRIRMLALLMEGRALTAKELALGAGVEPATASAHLKRLQADGLVESAPQGRHKYFRLASPQVAQLLESLMHLAPRRAAAPRTAAGDAPVRHARFCYDHLAGRVGSGLFAAMLDKGWLQDDADVQRQLVVTGKGMKALGTLGVDVAEAQSRRRLFACRCLDWSERRDHLAGALGAAIAQQMLSLGWIERHKRSRLVTVTPDGLLGLRRLGVQPQALSARQPEEEHVH
jgi:DNA-binding transcriptional ArsR family regulator